MAKSIFVGYNNVTTGHTCLTEVNEKDFIKGRNVAMNYQKKKKPDHSIGINQLIRTTSDKDVPSEIKSMCLQATITVVMVDGDLYCKDSNLYVLRVDQENQDFYLTVLNTNCENFDGNQEILKTIGNTDYNEYMRWANDRNNKESLNNRFRNKSSKKDLVGS
jgi:G:T-mismatch repair DNA endonuclease (very short patch repair protein)